VGIQSEDDIEWRGEVDSVARNDRCGFKGWKFCAISFAVDSMSVKGPNGVEVIEVVASDLGRPGKTQTAGVSAVSGPAVTDWRSRYGLCIRNCQVKIKKERSYALHVRGIALSGEEQTLASFHRDAFHIL
jgi:hypothetical protein